MKFSKILPRKHPFLKIYLKILILAIIGLPLRAKVVTAQDFTNTKLNGWIIDTIDILSPETESKLNRTINELEQQNGTEIIVLTLPETGSYSNTTDFAGRLLAYWSLEAKNLEDSVLLVYSRGDDRRGQKVPSSIEFSTGTKVAEVFSEGKVSTLMQEEIYPLLEQGKHEEAIIRASQGIINFLNTNTLETNRQNSFVSIIHNYYYFIITILGFSLIIVLILAFRNFYSSNQDPRKYVITGPLKNNSRQNFGAAQENIDNSTQPEIFPETLNFYSDDNHNFQVDNLEKSTVNISEKIAHHHSKGEDFLADIDFISHNQENENKEFIDDNIKHKIDFNNLELISLDDLENVVNKFQSLTLKLFKFVNDQEEELQIKHDLVKELQEKLTQCSSIEKLVLESKLQELEKSTSLLNQTLVGQRTNLKKQLILLAQHLIIFNRRKTKFNSKSIESIDYHKLENMPLNDLKNLVDNLENKYLNLVDFVNAQEEELKAQSYFLKQLEVKMSQSSSIQKSVLELEIKETKEIIDLLNKTLSGQRDNLKIKETILNRHLSIWNQRKIKLNDKKDDQTVVNLNINKVGNKKNNIFEKSKKPKESNFEIQYLPQTR